MPPIPLGQRCLLAYSTVLTGAVIVSLLTGFARFNRSGTMEELTVQRLNVVESDGTIRLVIASKSRFPGLIVKGKETPHPNRRTAGMLFFNEEGTENGGLIFDGSARGGVRASTGHLSFDAYEQDQVLSLDAMQQGDSSASSLTLVDRPSYSIAELIALSQRTATLAPERQRAEMARFFADHPSPKQRLQLGRNLDRSVGLTLRDTAGRERLVIQVGADGTPILRFLDDKGAVSYELPVPHR